MCSWFLCKNAPFQLLKNPKEAEWKTTTIILNLNSSERFQILFYIINVFPRQLGER